MSDPHPDPELTPPILESLVQDLTVEPFPGEILRHSSFAEIRAYGDTIRKRRTKRTERDFNDRCRVYYLSHLYRLGNVSEKGPRGGFAAISSRVLVGNRLR